MQLYQTTTSSRAAAQIVQFLQFLYHDQRGYIELCYINGDPQRERMQRDSWHYYTPTNTATIAQRCAQLVATYGNVYVSSTLYRRRWRNTEVALPSRIVFVDDAPERDDYTLAIRTSEHSRHAYYLVDRPVDAPTRRELQYRAAQALAADRSGSDVEQLVRIPCSYNTKHGGRFCVHVEAQDGPSYTIDQLRSRWPLSGPYNAPQAHDLDWSSEFRAAVNSWFDNVPLLLNRDGMPRRLKPHTQAARILSGELRPVNRTGDKSSSEARAFVTKGLILHGYPNEEIAALLLHLCDYGASESKGISWLERDISRVIRHYRAKHPNITINPTRATRCHTAIAQPRPTPKSRARRDRPQRITADLLFQRLRELHDAGGMVLMSRRELAKELGISVPTLDRLERQLREQGKAERRTSSDRRRSWIALLGAINIPPAQAQTTTKIVLSAESVQPIAEPQIQIDEPLKEEHTPLIAPLLDAAEVLHSTSESLASVIEEPQADRPVPAVAASFRMLDAMLAAIAAVATEQRVSKKRVQAVFAEYFPQAKWSNRTYARALIQRQREQQLERERAWTETATLAELRRRARSHAWNHTKAREAGNEARAYIFGTLGQIVEDAIEQRRGASAPARREQPVIEAPQGGLSGGCVPPSPHGQRVQHGVVLTSMIVPVVNASKVKFVLEQLPRRGPVWAWGYLDRVEGREYWPAHVRRAIEHEEREAIGSYID